MKKVLLVLSIVLVLTFAFAGVAYATDGVPEPVPTANSVADVIVDATDEVKSQAKTIFFEVVVWFGRAALAVMIFVLSCKAGVEHKHGGAVSVWPIVLLVVLLIASFPLANTLWGLLG